VSGFRFRLVRDWGDVGVWGSSARADGGSVENAVIAAGLVDISSAGRVRREPLVTVPVMSWVPVPRWDARGGESVSEGGGVSMEGGGRISRVSVAVSEGADEPKSVDAAERPTWSNVVDEAMPSSLSGSCKPFMASFSFSCSLISVGTEECGPKREDEYERQRAVQREELVQRELASYRDCLDPEIINFDGSHVIFARSITQFR